MGDLLSMASKGDLLEDASSVESPAGSVHCPRPNPPSPPLASHSSPIDAAESGPPVRSASEVEKVSRIQEACDKNDFESLVSLAVTEHGLVTEQLRRKACSSVSFNHLALR